MEHPLLCAHCARPAPLALPASPEGDNLWFCCRGCRAVYALLCELQEAA